MATKGVKTNDGGSRIGSLQCFGSFCEYFVFSWTGGGGAGLSDVSCCASCC